MSDSEIIISKKDTSISRKDSEEISAIGKAIASMPKESLKSLLYLAAGRQDSNYRLFRKPIFISVNDIKNLNERVLEKLRHYETEGMVAVDAMYKKNRAEQFGTWSAFENHNWDNSNIVESVTVRWDFLFKMPTYAIPQRHTLTVKLVSRLDPLHVLQALVSKDPSDLSTMELEAAPVVARVDFISHLLSDELLNIVEEWVESRTQAVFREGWRLWLKKNRIILARATHYSLPFICSLLSASILHWYCGSFTDKSTLTMLQLEKALYWLLFAGVLISFTTVLGTYFARKIYTALDDYGIHSLFRMTSGDENEQKRIANENKKEMKKFFYNSSWALLLNIIAAIFTYIFFKS